jgi:hypothetical protein
MIPPLYNPIAALNTDRLMASAFSVWVHTSSTTADFNNSAA